MRVIDEQPALVIHERARQRDLLSPLEPLVVRPVRRASGFQLRFVRAGDIGEAVRKGIAANKPYLIDVDIAADINPVGAGVWELPGLGQSNAGIGTRYQPA